MFDTRRLRDELATEKARVEMLVEENGRLNRDNRRLVDQIVELANRPPLIIRPELPDYPAVMGGIADLINPRYAEGPVKDEKLTQAGVVNWADNGLDNNGGVAEAPGSIYAEVPDAVLAVEGVDREGVRRGGWYNRDISGLPETVNGGSSGGPSGN